MTSSTHIGHTLLLNAHPPDIASTIFTEKVLHKPLHLRATSPNPTSQDGRAHRRLQRLRKKEKSQKKPKQLSAKQKRISGIYEIPKDAQKYEIYARLHQMWVGYMWEVLGIKEGLRAHVTAQGAGSLLATADYHGAEVLVVRSRCMGLVGLAGIVVRDTKFTFQIVTKNNELKSMSRCELGLNFGLVR
jgi:ribonuclease P protein subunit POP4